MGIFTSYKEYLILLLYLQFMKLKANYQLLEKIDQNNYPIFYTYYNKISALTTRNKFIVKSEGNCMKLCYYQLHCKAMDLEMEGGHLTCACYTNHQDLQYSIGGKHMTTKKPSISRYCTIPKNACGVCDCLNTVNSAELFICDCRPHQAVLDHYKSDCRETVGSNFNISGLYSIIPDGIEKVDVLCDYSNENEIVMTGFPGNTFPTDRTRYTEEFDWSNEYIFGFDKIKNLTDIHDYTLVVDFYSFGDAFNGVIEYTGFEIINVSEAKIRYDNFKVVEGKMTNVIPKVGTSCSGDVSSWYICNAQYVVRPKSIVWSNIILKYFRISLKRQQDIRLLSEGRPSKSSTTHYTGAVSKFAFDGNTDISSPMFHSVAEYTPWLMVDLEANYSIIYTVIYNRMDVVWSKRLTDAQIQVSTNSAFVETNFQICATFPTLGSTAKSFPCENGTKGQYVRIILGLRPGFYKFLHIREMKVFGWK